MIYGSLIVSTLLSLSPAAARPGDDILKSLLKSKSMMESLYHRGMQQEQSDGPSFLNGEQRRLEDREGGCDAAFFDYCLYNEKCFDCFSALQVEAVDWTGVTRDTQCPDVVDFLVAGGHCKRLKGDKRAIEAFCDTFEACVVWEDAEDTLDDDYATDPDWVNCTALTECKWEGMKENWIGDGICHDNLHGCYNTAVCGYDGGDCCEDTCTDKDSKMKECGHDGYFCRDPNSENCDSYITKCPGDQSQEEKRAAVTCKENEAKYRLVMYDSFGDGWDTTTVTIKKKGEKRSVYSGGLEAGSEGTDYLCLSKEPTCYNAKTEGGVWGVEVSWELKPLKEGSPALAGSGAPDDCDFPVAGDECEKTCDGRPDFDPSDDPDYVTYKELVNCMQDQCLIQLGACEADPFCVECFKEEAPSYCFGMDDFVAVIDCTMCSCTEKKDSIYCSSKGNPASGGAPAKPPPPGKPQKCTPIEIRQGTKALMDFSKCTDLGEIDIMVTEYDQNNFGQLDTFEACSHSFQDEENHGGHTALGCMRILYDSMTNPSVKDNPDAPKEAISALAKNLYEDGESFCDCVKQGSEDCPLCPSFMSFKTLMYESIDACHALDEIDCDAWSEFWKPCKENLELEFGKSDFKTKDQCTYTKERQCGGAGPFPAFRRLDCGKEIAKDAWDFYNKFSDNCLKDSPVAPSRAPVPSPTKGKPYNAPTDAPSREYKPSGSKNKKKSHWFRNFLVLCALGGGGYYFYKKRAENFNFVQYRRVRNFGNSFGNPFGGGGGGYEMGDDGGMYSNLNQSTTFEPPTLPPTPAMMGTEMT